MGSRYVIALTLDVLCLLGFFLLRSSLKSVFLGFIVDYG